MQEYAYRVGFSQNSKYPRKQWISGIVISLKEEREQNKKLKQNQINKVFQGRMNQWHWYYTLRQKKIKNAKTNSDKICIEVKKQNEIKTETK